MTDQRFKPRVQAIDIAGRIPPHNDNAEAAVLSAILTEQKALDLVIDILPDGTPFYADANRRIYDTAIELHRNGVPVDITTVADVLRRTERLQAIGGLTYLAHLVDKTPAVAHIEAHAKIIVETYRIRQLIETCQQVAAEGYGDYGNAQEFLDAAESRIYTIAHERVKSPVTLAYDVIKESFEELEAAARRGGRILGIPTGFTDVDEMTSGMGDGDLIIIAARPGMGKTAYALNIAVNVASPMNGQAPDGEVEDQRPCTYGVMVFTLEMPQKQLSNRMLCSEGMVSNEAFRKGMVQGEDWERLTQAANRLSSLPLWFDESPAISVLEMRARVRRQQAEFNKRNEDGTFKQRLGLVVVDYLQLMRATSGNPTQTREQEVSSISRGLKAMAKELKIPVVALSQLNRSVETRGKEKRPQLSDLRESGAIEQDADLIQFIYRPEYYISDKRSPEAQKVKGIAEIIIAKQRNGPTGKAVLRFFDSSTRFVNRDKNEAPYSGDDED